nr:tetratricopeptide repeat protein [Candidatus Sigynarchaeota archaeon]
MEGFLKETKLVLKDFMASGEKNTFLVGAGCSMDKPSCMPSGRSMLGNLVKFMCPATEVDNILKMDNLRYEGVVEEFRNQFDKELKLITFFEACERPNIQHFFLADALKRGHFLLTTNFDFLIELALMNSGVPKDNIVPVITKKDFETFNDPSRLFAQGKIGVYKVHGSTRNFITGEATRDSLIATLQAFGSNKVGLSVFQVESFKQALFTNITSQRSLIVMGYSGGDDFDVIPTLKVLTGLKNVIWLNFVLDDGGLEKVYEIIVEPGPAGDITGTKQILAEMKQQNRAEHVYWVEVNTSRAVETLLQEKPRLHPNNFTINTLQWMQEMFPAPSDWYKFHVAYILYLKLGHYQDALRCAEAMLPLAKDTSEKIAPVENVARILLETGKYNDALAKYYEAWSLVSQVNDVTRQATYSINIGELNRRLGNVNEALKWYSTGLQLSNATGDKAKKEAALINLGGLYSQMGYVQQAMQLYNQALPLTDELGNLSDKAQLLNNMGTAFANLGAYQEALKHFEIGLQIAEKLGDQARLIRLLINTGNMYVRMVKYPEALGHFNRALQAADKIGDLAQKADVLNNIGSLLKSQEKFSEAASNFNAALEIAEKLGELNIKLQCLIALGSTNQVMEKIPEALDFYEKAFQVAGKLNNAMQIATIHNNVGVILRDQGKFEEALPRLQESLNTAEKSGFQELKAYVLKNIGSTYYEMKDDEKALDFFNKSFQIAGQYPSLLSVLFEAMGDLFKRQGKTTEAVTYFTQALQFLQQLGLQNSPKATKIAEKMKPLA